MNWRELLTRILENKKDQPRFRSKPTFFPPAASAGIKELESSLNTRIPSSLQSLLQETNGVMEMLSIDGGEWSNDLWLIWPIEEIIKENLFFRSEREKGVYEREFDQLVFFTSAGCDGILFAHSINQDRVAEPHVLVWHPIEDELAEIARTLKDFIEGWCTGKISV